MDKIDKKLITLLQQNARMPLKALAEKVFLSSPAVSARIERLEKEEIIEGYEVKINQLKLGYHITAFIGQLQKFGRTSTQIVFSTPVAPRGIDVNAEMPADE